MVAVRIAGVATILLVLAGCDAVQDKPGEEAKPATTPELAVGQAVSTPLAEISLEAPMREAPKVEPPKVSVVCADGEETIFSCKTQSGNDLAVCAGGENVHYRFGKGSPDMSLMGARWATVGYSGGGEAQILFSNGDTNYIVFSRTVRTNFEPGEPNNPAISDGVIVTRGDKVVAMQECEGGQAEKPIDYNLADTSIAVQETALFTEETGRAD